MRQVVLGLACVVSVAALSGCVGDYGGGAVAYGGYGPVGYDGFYDDYYGPVYDGYWGDDGAFWYRGGAHDRHFRRGDPAHFARTMPQGGAQHGPGFHPMHGAFTRSRGMATPHFGGASGGRGR